MTEEKQKRSSESVTLALSGGGFRATLFHLGAILCLADTGLLSKVRRIYAVSGGSILAAHIGLNWEAYRRLCKGLDKKDNGSTVKESEKESESRYPYFDVLAFTKMDLRWRFLVGFLSGSAILTVLTVVLVSSLVAFVDFSELAYSIDDINKEPTFVIHDDSTRQKNIGGVTGAKVESSLNAEEELKAGGWLYMCTEKVHEVAAGLLADVFSIHPVKAAWVVALLVFLSVLVCLLLIYSIWRKRVVKLKDIYGRKLYKKKELKHFSVTGPPR